MCKKIVIASDSYKGSASSLEIGQSIEKGIHELRPDYKTKVFSIADGGEGTVASILNVLEGVKRQVTVTGPLGTNVQATYGIIQNGQIAVMEMAEASGITLVPKGSLDVMKATTYGTGEMIRDALDQGVSKIYIGVGGSATNDGGLGMAEALGVRFCDDQGRAIAALSENLSLIAKVDLTGLDKRLKHVETIILSDVTNPLCGENGASAVYGPQKGANVQQIALLDRGLCHLAELLAQETGLDRRDEAGAGAAGGLGYGLMMFLKAKVKRGVETVLELIEIEKDIATADLVITGEGRMDSQSLNGKAPIGIAQIAQKYGIPTVAIVGSASTDLETVYHSGIAGVVDIVNAPMSLETAMAETQKLVQNAARNLISLYATFITKL